MTSEQCFSYVTRGIAMFCLITAFVALTYLGPDVLEAVHFWRLSHAPNDAASSLASAQYYFRYYLLRTAVLVLQLAMLLWAAGWLYRGGEGVRKFFGPSDLDI